MSVGFPVALAAASPMWLAATNNPPAKVVITEASHAARGFLSHIFWIDPFSAGGFGAHDTLRALFAGAVAGLGQGLPASDLGQAFAWPYLLKWPAAALPDIAPALWCACILGAALGLALLLRADWAAVLRGGTDGPDTTALICAAVPAFLLRWLLRHLTFQLESAATIGVCLAVTGELVLLANRLADREEGRGTAIPPWLAALAGIAAGLVAALPGVSMLAVLLLGALYGRTSAEAAGRFAIMAATIVAALLGLFALPSAVHALDPSAAFAFIGAALGGFAGGWALLRWILPARARALPVLASYCAAVGGLLLLFGVFAA